MNDFPIFMKNPKNRIPKAEQNTHDIGGYCFQGADNQQIADWTCHSDQVSKTHINDFDEYLICVAGQYKALINNKEITLNPGDELCIPGGTEQGGSAIAGTRTIHFFNGKRIE